MASSFLPRARRASGADWGSLAAEERSSVASLSRPSLRRSRPRWHLCSEFEGRSATAML